ncbi:a-pheromone processing metallopeptidase ste23 [Colletotrichum chrysophilum]|uniref:A-pheromone processing metallopeptidase ste23 n=1 Tax=Colletotrichum chrysophilum TaxID=1836956 RepID=A0AAD9ECU6_9PEZI|nr:a-pheromone processing metallopeptidase ste23 [Colletotrichum chrysophilum]
MTAPKPAPVEQVTENLEKPLADKRTYRVTRLSNKLEALLVHDPETDKASAALDVHVGSFSDEEDMAGMAHAVEHLLSRGTKKFPMENEYSQYLASNSGTSNAYTGATSTNYHLEVSAKPANDMEPSASNPSPFKGALDRFAQFFIKPLFLESILDRELRAVDSENKKNLQSDQWRLRQLIKSLSNPNHPFSHFSTGNFEVLKTQPEANGVNVRAKFMEFHEKHYSANRMKLVVLGREPLDVLEDWVAELFTAVSNKDLVPNRWEPEVPFRESELGVQVFAKPVKNLRELSICFPFLDQESMFESRPSRYISHLIGHEGPGSIMAYLKEKGWANKLNALGHPACAGTPGIFDCQISLTEKGLENYKDVVKIVFQYVSLLRESTPQEWIFDEIKTMDDIHFKCREKAAAIRFATETSAAMQRPLPREWLLSGYNRLRKFDSRLIDEGLTCLKPDNFRLTIVSQKLPGGWDQTEKWYGTEYRHEKIPDDFMAEIKKAASSPASDRLAELHLPHKNNFIPTKLEVEKKEVKEPAVAPRVIRDDSIARTWFKKDDTFWVPKANLFIAFRNPSIYSTAENAVKARLFTDLVRDALESYSYDAKLAGLHYSVTLDARGLLLKLSGYNDKMAVLLEEVLMTMRYLGIKDERFDIIKERLSRGYNNQELRQPFHQVSDYTTWLNSERHYVVEESLTELPNITSEDVRQFRKQMLSHMHIESYVHGNLYKEDALKLTDMIETILKPRELPRLQLPDIRSLVLPAGSNHVYKKTLKDPANVNHCIEVWLYVGDKSDRITRAKTMLLEQMTEEPAFNQLRTKEQLGYVVFTGLRSFSTTYGFRFIIQSERTPEYLELRIEAFLNHFANNLDSMSETDFEGHKRSLIVKCLEKLKNLDQESNRHWAQIASENYDFELAQDDAAHIKLLTKADMIEFFQQYIKPGSSTRAKLSVHLHAQASSSTGTEATMYGVREESGAASTSEPVPIKDVRSFRAGLQATRGARPAKDLSEYEDMEVKL